MRFRLSGDAALYGGHVAGAALCQVMRRLALVLLGDGNRLRLREVLIWGARGPGVVAADEPAAADAARAFHGVQLESRHVLVRGDCVAPGVGPVLARAPHGVAARDVVSPVDAAPVLGVFPVREIKADVIVLAEERRKRTARGILCEPVTVSSTDGPGTRRVHEIDATARQYFVLACKNARTLFEVVRGGVEDAVRAPDDNDDGDQHTGAAGGEVRFAHTKSFLYLRFGDNGRAEAAGRGLCSRE